MPRLLLLLALGFSACSLAGPDPLGEGTGTLVNRTDVWVYAFAVDSETAALIDIAPAFTLRPEDRENVVPPDGAGPLDVENYDPGDDVVVFVYRVDGDEAEFAEMIQVDGETFEDDRGVVTVRRL